MNQLFIEMLEQLNIPNLENLPNLNVHLLNRRVTCMTVPAIVEAIHTACFTKKKIVIAHYNAHGFNLSMQLPWFYNFLQEVEIAHCDGSGILKAMSYMGLELPIQYRASYTDLMPSLLQHCYQHDFSIFLLGSKPQHLEAALDRLRKQYPSLKLSGHHGYFKTDDPHQNETVIRQINSAKPDILIVGMGMPLQENWIRLHRDYLNVHAIMCGGAIIDRLAGVITDCPKSLSNLGLEWLYRLCCEPKRLAARYLFGNPAFAFQVALAKLYGSQLKVECMRTTSHSCLKGQGSSDALSTCKLEYDSSTEIYSSTKHFGHCLVEAGLLTQAQVEIARSEQKSTGMNLDEVLIHKKWLNQQTIEYFKEKAVLLDRSMSLGASLHTKTTALL
ncbi:WecB/TagA/CpsF family glycosyltransferase [Chroococcidiopsis sp [FACHB-1243]]|uniref:WecB/TagA/CpsF family glycosyltransferase n=1 Tax=Chroococcidiopsis sp. [FACHB-1243] TaxID=2692781 RepID=UPI0018EF72DF|nr:WecB/TagA/CpsF family glycosyltransferase [Chroococcidiopsis sp. [FACHB-1243]]